MATAKAIPDAVSAQALSESESDQSDGEDVTVIPETPLQSESEDEEGVDLLRVGVCWRKASASAIVDACLSCQAGVHYLWAVLPASYPFVEV